MTSREATAMAGAILGRYPSARVDELVLEVWGRELLARFEPQSAMTIMQLALEFCRRNPNRWAPSVDELCAWIQGRLRAAAGQTRLPDTKLAPAQIAANKARLRDLAALVST